MMKQNHPFHLVTQSPWPILTSLTLLNIFIITIKWFHNMKFLFTFTPLCMILCLILCLYQWWRDISRESTLQGHHTLNVYNNMRLGMILFIVSEIMFFFSFFWAYFHSFLAPAIEIGQMWPPMGIIPFNPFDIPLLNTIILISSGITVTWSHHSLTVQKFKESTKSLMLTIMLGIYFTSLQMIEYYYSPFTLADSIYGSIFFISTGFHGLHVIIGTLFLLFCYIRLKLLHFSSTHHFGMEAAIWYWHFVDVVWLFLYLNIYWWSY